MENNRNFFITIALSVLILSLWQYFYVLPQSEAQREKARIEEQRVAEQKKAAQSTSPSGSEAPVPQQGAIPNAAGPNAPGTDGTTPAGREQALASTQRVKIDTPSLKGSINLTGARLDDLRLKHYTTTVDKNSPEIELLNPAALPTGYYAEIGFVGSDKTGAVPGPETTWTVDGNATLTPATPVTLTFTNDKG
ncbi:MAG: membrane protein insertase YidC, partial [Mesorhizobium sp.]